MSAGLGRIPSNGGRSRALRKAYRTSDEGIREYDPRPKPKVVIVLTTRTSPSVRTTVGWRYPLEHDDQKLSPDPLSQYAEFLPMGSNGNADMDSVRNILLEARNRLTDPEYDRLRGYVDVLMVGRMAGPLPPGD